MRPPASGNWLPQKIAGSRRCSASAATCLGLTAKTIVGSRTRPSARAWLAVSNAASSSVDLYLHQQALDTSTPAGRALFQMLGVFAEFERAMIVERMKAGLRRATAQGKKLGRPRVAEKLEKAVLLELEKGRGIHTMARAVGVGTGTVQRIMKRAAVA